MCNFVSWIRFEKKIYFLQNEDLDTKDGLKLLIPDVVADLCGHGALRSFYPELKNKGVNEECEDFSTPKNFPKEIVTAIKRGNLSQKGICLAVLNEKGEAEYKKISQPALAEYEKIEQPAWAEYEKIRQTAWAEYRKISQTASAEYGKIEQPVFGKIIRQKKYRADNWK